MIDMTKEIIGKYGADCCSADVVFERYKKVHDDFKDSIDRKLDALGYSTCGENKGVMA